MSNKDKNVPSDLKKAVGEIRQIAGSIDALKKDLRDGKTTDAEYREAATKAASELLAKAESLETKTDKLETQQEIIEKSLARMTGFGTKETKGLPNVKELKALNQSAKEAGGEGVITLDNFDLIKKGFETYFFKGEKGINLEFGGNHAEFKSINSVLGPSGGFTVPTTESRMITSKTFDGRGIFENVGRMTMPTADWSELFDLGDYADSLRKSELDAFNIVHVNNKKMIKLKYSTDIQVYEDIMSRTFEEDSWNDSNYYIDKMLGGMGRDAANGIVLGTQVDGTKMTNFESILNATAGSAPVRLIEDITSENAAADLAFSWGDAIKMIRATPDEFHGNSKFYTKRQTFFDLIIEKDNEGRYQTNNFLNFFNGQGGSMQILSHDVVWDTAMEDTATSGNIPVLFGDLERAYLYVERPGLTIIRDDTGNAEWITFRLRRRNGGFLRQTEAVKRLKMQ